MAMSKLFGLILLVAFFGNAALAQNTGDISSMVHELRKVSTQKQRVEILERFEATTREMSPEVKVCPRDVIYISMFLDDGNRQVVHFAAMILGNFGREARIAVPALEAAAKRLDAEEDEMIIKPTQPLATEVHLALMKIDGRALPEFR